MIKVKTATAGLHGFDCDSVLTPSSVAAFKAAGFTFAVRYVSLGAVEPAYDLTAKEIDDILSGGLALMPVQHVRYEGWMPDEIMGRTYGHRAAAHCKEVGIFPGVTVWLDLEGISTTVPASAVIAYCNAWWGEVAAAGYEPGVYVGARSILTGGQLYFNLRMKRYWRSGSFVPPIPYRGYQMVQEILGESIGGVQFDRNITLADNFGSLPTWQVQS